MPPGLSWSKFMTCRTRPRTISRDETRRVLTLGVLKINSSEPKLDRMSRCKCVEFKAENDLQSLLAQGLLSQLAVILYSYCYTDFGQVSMMVSQWEPGLKEGLIPPQCVPQSRSRRAHGSELDCHLSLIGSSFHLLLPRWQDLEIAVTELSGFGGHSYFWGIAESSIWKCRHRRPQHKRWA